MDDKIAFDSVKLKFNDELNAISEDLVKRAKTTELGMKVLKENTAVKDLQ